MTEPYSTAVQSRLIVTSERGVAQDIRRRVTACFIALAGGQRIAGYYTLASASLLLADLPATTAKKLPRYPTVPVVRMGRLAIEQAFKGQGLGGALLADALDRATRSEIASPLQDSPFTLAAATKDS